MPAIRSIFRNHDCGTFFRALAENCPNLRRFTSESVENLNICFDIDPEDFRTMLESCPQLQYLRWMSLDHDLQSGHLKVLAETKTHPELEIHMSVAGVS